MRKVINFIPTIPILLYLSLAAWGDSIPPVQDIRVGIIETPPFVIKQEEGYSGIAIDIWSLIASQAHLKYHFVPHPNANFDDAITSLAQGKYDVLVGPISMTEERIHQVDYTLPFYLAHIGILSLRSAFSFVENLLTTFIYTIGVLATMFFILFFIHINILWFTEKKGSNNFLGSYKRGVQKIFWDYISEGKYTGKSKSLEGRIAILIWLIIGYTLLTIINGSIIAFITVGWYQFAHPIQTASELESKRLAANRGSSSYHLARDMAFNIRPVSDISEGIALLKNGKIDAYITPSAEAEIYLEDHEEFDIILSPATFRNDLYYFATPIDSPLRRVIDIQMAELHKNNIGVSICKKYLSDRANNCDL